MDNTTSVTYMKRKGLSTTYPHSWHKFIQHCCLCVWLVTILENVLKLKTGQELIKALWWCLSVPPRRPCAGKCQTIFAEWFKSFCYVLNMCRYLSFSRHHSLVNSAAFCPDTSDIKVSFAFIHFPVPINICYFRFHRVHSGSMLITCFLRFVRKKHVPGRLTQVVEQTDCSKMVRQLPTMSFLVSLQVRKTARWFAVKVTYMNIECANLV